MALPDANDRHVLAAAVRAGAQVIVTKNLDDFPPDALTPYGLHAEHPDAFILGLMELDMTTVTRAIETQGADLRTPRTLDEMLPVLLRQGGWQLLAYRLAYVIGYVFERIRCGRRYNCGW